MMNPTLHEAFRYSAWATKTLIAACKLLSTEQLKRPARRGYGSILTTLNHIVISDAHYVAILTGTRPTWLLTEGDDDNVDNETDDLDEIETRVDEIAHLWEQLFLVDKPVDAERLLSLDEGKYECHTSVVVVQALHHAHAHREQIRAALRNLDVQPPDVQPWEYALESGRAHWRREN